VFGKIFELFDKAKADDDSTCDWFGKLGGEIAAEFGRHEGALGSFNGKG